ncbi:hypothetical protein [Actinacidiphila bryophytorum]|uniref:Uncharacterized protein n=1 Tax=Actinacidiphila bryophytorum TaxID=1436133 RepID=A0A9W4H0H2_9ACTN|nr:hypothetical protein [Actinacidiphila bryophytorum]MBM9438731.1 hypothetical protein [Actinacidiphila bryophytorum]MBN6546017.1 hypothetical protein [Actinacidiphila bryophytorum]CAG7637662.1 conserved exported hypothetical protein [Actinacidiphila bryophytorum]
MTLLFLAIACLIGVTMCYAAVCAGSPFGRCRKCNGVGYATKVNRRGKVSRGKPCRRCKTTGHRIRVGRHLFNIAQRLYREGTAPAVNTATDRTREGVRR